MQCYNMKPHRLKPELLTAMGDANITCCPARGADSFVIRHSPQHAAGIIPQMPDVCAGVSRTFIEAQPGGFYLLQCSRNLTPISTRLVGEVRMIEAKRRDQNIGLDPVVNDQL